MLDFTNFTQPGGMTAAQDTITIKITPVGKNPTTVTVTVREGASPALIAATVADNLEANGFGRITVNGGVVTFRVFGDATSSTMTHINAINGKPELTSSLAKN